MSTPEPQRQRRARHTKPRKPQSEFPMPHLEEGATDHVVVSAQQPASMSSTFPIPSNGAPQTPARKQSSRNIPNSEQRPRTEPERDHSTSRKKRRPKPNHNPDESAPTTGMTNNTPAPIMEPATTSTPRPVSQNPAEFYAGPTFHNSPAPSSLPVPKFLRKSTPKVPKVDGAGSASDDRNSESSTSPENSPMPRKALFQAEQQQQQKREESPLDIFFQADRQEKVAKSQGLPYSRPDETPGRYFRSEQTARSPSPSNRSAAHQRPTNEQFSGQHIPRYLSENQMNTRPPPIDFPSSRDDGTKQTAPASNKTYVESTIYDDELQRKTAELKKMLMDFKPSPSSEAIKPLVAQPVYKDYTTPNSTRVINNQPHSHFRNHSRPGRDMPPRPTSSSLRREVASYAAQGASTSSTLPPTQDLAYMSPPPPNQPQVFHSNSQKHGATSMPSNPFGLSTPSHLDTVPNRAFQHGVSGTSDFGRSSPMRSMEDDLRRILKMEPSQDRILDVRS